MKRIKKVKQQYKPTQLKLYPEGLDAIVQEVCAHFNVHPSAALGYDERGKRVKRSKDKATEVRVAICYFWRQNQVVDYKTIAKAMGFKTASRVYRSVRLAIGYMKSKGYREMMNNIQNRLDSVLETQRILNEATGEKKKRTTAVKREAPQAAAQLKLL